MILKKSIVSLLIASLMVSTMGITINTLYCMCLDKMETSFFEFQESCPLALDSCCKKEAKGCCSKSNSNQNLPCSKKDATYFKLNTEFEKPQLSDFVLPVTTTTITRLPVLVEKYKVTNFTSIKQQKGPPLLYLRHNVFRC